MTFIHEDLQFPSLLEIVQGDLAKKGLQMTLALVEKDYWVTHTLWALHHLGLEVWFKGGTSLSKGFGLIQRFSEDLDLKIEGGRQVLPEVTSWKSGKPGSIAKRLEFFEAIAKLNLPELDLQLDPGSLGEKCMGAGIEARYPGLHIADLEPSMKPFVLLEVGEARVKPFLERPLSSFVHDFLETTGQLETYLDNRPERVRCIHPMVTLIEKLDAIQKRFNRGDDPADFVRHYEDAAHIILRSRDLPELPEYGSPVLLLQDMLSMRQIRQAPSPDDPAFNPDPGLQWKDIEATHAAIGGMFWGERIDLKEANQAIRNWMLANPV